MLRDMMSRIVYFVLMWETFGIFVLVYVHFDQFDQNEGDVVTFWKFAKMNPIIEFASLQLVKVKISGFYLNFFNKMTILPLLGHFGKYWAQKGQKRGGGGGWKFEQVYSIIEFSTLKLVYLQFIRFLHFFEIFRHP